MNVLKKIHYKLQTFFLKSRLKSSGKFMVCNPLRVIGANYIEIEDKVFIREQIWLEAIKDMDEPSIQIKEGVYIGDFAHINACKKILIEEDVLIANQVFITDHNHNFEDLDLPIRKQGIKVINEVTIGKNSWLGEKVSVIGASVGRNCIIGANSVVTKDIPDYSIAVGSPARIIKRYCSDTKSWVSVK